jgi:hypothetical protein
MPGAPIRIFFEPGRSSGALPRELDVELALPVVSGTGKLIDRGDSEYAGVLSVKLPPLSANAMGVLRFAGPGRDLSFLVVIGATFPPPGVQLGFGFSVSGIGGIVGVNRRINRDALLRAVVEGWAADLLFPADPIAAADTIIPALGTLFPAARGSVVAGPMFQLSWGGRLVNASVAVLSEVSDQVRLSIVGKLVVAIPDPEAPLISLRATFLGEVDPGEPRVSFLASLTGSTMVGLPLSGDLLLLTRGGADPTFVLSAGGFHPAFPVPRGVPRLRRIGMDLSPGPLLQLRCEAYLAITSNTVQFGARLELEASVAGCGLRGHLSLDVLVQWQPHLFFVADISAGIAIRVAGQNLVGVTLDLSLSGPTPWRVRGRGSVDLFLFSVSFDFDEQWGSPPPAALAPPDVAAQLRAALEDSDAWVVQRGGPGAGGVQLTPAADRALGQGALVDPYASLTARQRRVPLAVTIERFERVPLAPGQQWDIAEARLGALPAPVQHEIREQFAPGQFLALSDDEQLSRPAFERFRAGVSLISADVVMPDPRPADLDFETKILPEETPFTVAAAFAVDAVEALLVAQHATDPVWWQKPVEQVSVAAEIPVAAASSWSMVEAAAAPTAATATELHQALARQDGPALTVVEQWELQR